MVGSWIGCLGLHHSRSEAFGFLSSLTSSGRHVEPLGPPRGLVGSWAPAAEDIARRCRDVLLIQRFAVLRKARGCGGWIRCWQDPQHRPSISRNAREYGSRPSTCPPRVPQSFAETKCHKLPPRKFQAVRGRAGCSSLS